MGLAWDALDFLRGEHEADAGELGRRVGEEGVVEAAAAAKAMAVLVEGEAGDEDAIEFRPRDERTADGIGLAQAHGPARDDVVPAGDLVPVEFRAGAALEHEGQDDALALRPGLLDEGMDVGLGGERGEERDAFAFAKRGMVGRDAADEERGLGADGGIERAQMGAHFTAQIRLGVKIAHGKKRCISVRFRRKLARGRA